MPRRTSAWSSTIKILMSSPCSSDGEHRDDRGAVSRSRFDVERSAEGFRSGPHDPYPEVVVLILHRGDTAPAIFDLDPNLGSGRRHAHVRGRCPGMLRGVREGLADDRVNRLEHLFVRRLEVSLDLDRHGEVPADAEVADERGERGLTARRVLIRHLEQELPDPAQVVPDLAFHLRRIRELLFEMTNEDP